MTTDRKKAKTVLDTERDAVNEQGEALEFLDAITSDDEASAAKLLLERQAEADKATVEDQIDKIEELERARKFKKKEYAIKLATMMNQMLKHADFPTGYTHWVGFNEEKVNIIITDKDGGRFGRGIIITGMPKYDLHAIGILITQCENTIDKLLSRGNYREDGIVLPK